MPFHLLSSLEFAYNPPIFLLMVFFFYLFSSNIRVFRYSILHKYTRSIILSKNCYNGQDFTKRFVEDHDPVRKTKERSCCVPLAIKKLSAYLLSVRILRLHQYEWFQKISLTLNLIGSGTNVIGS